MVGWIVSKKRLWLSSLLDHCRFQVGGTHVDTVASFVHLGHTINTELTDKDDILHKRCSFIRQENSVLCHFPQLDADVRLSCLSPTVVISLVVNCGV